MEKLSFRDDRGASNFLRTSAPPERREAINLGHGLIASREPTGLVSLQTRVRRRGDKNARRVTLGTFKHPGSAQISMTITEARAALAAVRQMAESGSDPTLEKRRQATAVESVATLSRLVETYLARRRPDLAPKSYIQERDALATLQRLLGDPMLGDIRPRDVGAVLNAEATRLRRAGRTGRSANVILGATRRLFKRAAGWGIIDAIDPTVGLTRPAKDRPRERILHDPLLLPDRLDRGWNETGILAWGLMHGDLPLEPDARAALRLVQLLGFRAAEVAALEWRGVQLEDDLPTITVTMSKTRAGLRTLPLPPCAVSIMIELRARKVGDETFVFPARAGAARAPHVHPESLTRALRRSLPNLGLEHATLHDLRRTTLSGLGELGHEGGIANRIAGHEGPSVMERHYDRSSRLPAMARALDQWAAHVAAVAALAAPPIANPAREA
jgi:integrase